MGEVEPPPSEDFEPQAPAAPMYRYMQSLRYPLTLRAMMIEPVRTGYIGEDQKLTPSVTLPTPAQLFPDITMRASTIPRADGEIPCVIHGPQRPPSPTDPGLLSRRRLVCRQSGRLRVHHAQDQCPHRHDRGRRDLSAGPRASFSAWARRLRHGVSLGAPAWR
jgi:hypothetical protein